MGVSDELSNKASELLKKTGWGLGLGGFGEGGRGEVREGGGRKREGLREGVRCVEDVRGKRQSGNEEE